MVAFFFVIHFSIQNKEEVLLQYSLSHYQVFALPPVPLFIVMLGSVFFGVLLVSVGDVYRRLEIKKTLRHHQKTIERLEEEIHSLRTLGTDQTDLPKSDVES